MLHCVGSLKSLGKDFCPELGTKGFFPYLYGRLENINSILPGPPPLEFFGRCRTLKDRQELEKWHAEFEGQWCFQTEMRKYCVQDVLLQAGNMRAYHNIAMNSTGLTPWLNTTAPGFVHEVIGAALTAELELPKVCKNMDKDDFTKKADWAIKNRWVVQKPNEYWFDRKALSGGRTDVKQLSCEITPQDLEAGRRIVYQDITSQYPYQQMVHQFPVGVPTIQCWDNHYKPCLTCVNSPTPKCLCHNKLVPKELTVEMMETQPTAAEICRDKEFFGICCVTLVPPTDLLFPVFVFFDANSKKSLSTLRPADHVEMFCTSVELKRAFEVGYELITIHRLNKYKALPSLWSDKMGGFYLEKLLNSGDAPPTPEAKQALVDAHSDFGRLPELMAASWGRWGKNPAKKRVAKIMMNSMWGKHAQRPILTESLILDHADDVTKVDQVFANFMNGNYKGIDCHSLSDSKVMYRYTASGPNVKTDFHKGYLPVAVFVTAYARLQLFDQMHQLGKRVLYHDTDSIVYMYDPREYNIPFGDILGEWSEEDISIPTKHGGIKKFIALGPKTYAIKCFDGTELVKAKGISLSLATEQQVNFAVMDRIVTAFIQGERPEQVDVYQQGFVNGLTTYISTVNTMKILRINPREFKGEYRDGFMYPFGFE